MKTYAAAPGMKNGVCQQMVQVHRHGRQQDEPVSFPVLAVIQVSDQSYGEEVEGVMDESLQRLKFRIKNSLFKILAKDTFF